jgi:hypothetical protein
MSEIHVPRRLPVWFGLAAATPTLLLAAQEVSRELQGPTLGLPFSILFALWLFTTLPLIFVVAGMRILMRDQDAQARGREVHEAMELLVRADQMAQRQAIVLAKVEALLAEPRAAAAERPAPTGVGRRRLLLGALLLGFLVAAAGIGYAFTQAPHADPVHVHAAFAVFDQGERVSFVNPAFDLSQRGQLNGHLHFPNGDLLHIEGPPGATLATLLRNAVAANLTATTLQLDGLAHAGRVLAPNATAALHVYVAPNNSTNWRPVMDPASYAPADHDRILLSFGAPDAAELAREEAMVGMVPGTL